MNLIEEVNKRKIAIFDFDGLMVNSEQVIFVALQKLFAKYDIDLTWSYFAHHIGMPVAVVLPQFYRDHSIPLSYEDFLTQRKQAIKIEMETSLKLMPGLTSLISILTQRNFVLAIGTSAKRKYLENILHKHHLYHFFANIVTIDEVDRGKPYPDLFLAVLKQANFVPEDAFILEDSPSGIQAAKAAGVMSVAVPAPMVDLSFFSDATFTISSLELLVKSFDKAS